MTAPLHALGQVVATPGALALLEESGEEPGTYIARHVRGDWGTVGRYEDTELSADEQHRGAFATSDDAKLNTHAIRYGGRTLSAYDLPGGRLWVITDGIEPGGSEAYSTTLLLPDEY